jgi:hypothetical protein
MIAAGAAGAHIDSEQVADFVRIPLDREKAAEFFTLAASEVRSC